MYKQKRNKMQNLPSPFQSFTLPELQRLLILREKQKELLNHILSVENPEKIFLVVWDRTGFTQLSFKKELPIPPEFREFYASLFDRIQGEIWLLEAAIEKLVKLN